MLHAQRLVRRRTAVAVAAAIVRADTERAVRAAVAGLAAAHGRIDADLLALAAPRAVVGTAFEGAVRAASALQAAALPVEASSRAAAVRGTRFERAVKVRVAWEARALAIGARAMSGAVVGALSACTRGSGTNGGWLK